MDSNLSQNSTLTLDMVYHPNLAQTWHFYQYIIFFFSTIMVSLTSYIVLTKSSSEMGIYKLLLLNQLLWAYLFDVVLAVWQPVILFPFFICYSAGVVKVFGPMSVYPMYILMAIAYGGMIQSIILSMMFRVARLYTKTFWFENKKIWQKIGTGIFIVIQLLISIPTIVWLFTPDTSVEIVRKKIISMEPIMEKVVELEPTTNGFDWDSGRVILIVGFFDYGLIFIILIPFILSCSVIFVQRMKHLRSTTNLQTFRLQIMLFKTLVVQTVLVLLTVAMPVVVLDALLFLKIQNGSLYAQITLFPLCIHALADTFTMLYFIKIYRNYLKNKLKSFLDCFMIPHTSVHNLTNFP